MITEVYIVTETGGEYDSYYENPILVYATKEEGDAAVEALRAEMKLVWALPDPYDEERYGEKIPGEEFQARRNRILGAWNDKVREICRVYPIQTNGEFQGVAYSDATINGNVYPISIPDAPLKPDFGASVMPISKLPN